MTKKEALKVYQETRKKINAYYLLMATASFDRLTIAPKKGSKVRNEALAFIDGELFTLMSDPAYVDAVVFLSKQELKDPLKRDVYLTMRSLDSLLKFSKEEQMAYSLAQMESNEVWQKAKNEDDYASFEPHLKKMFEMTIERSKRRDPKKDPYDVCLDDFEEGMRQKDYDRFFFLIRKELVPLIKEIEKRQDQIDDSFLYLYYPREKQEAFQKELHKYLGFDPSWGCMGVS
ncbi:MAG: hypothetical protein IIZ33_07135, partial [Erysipelotrichaceae bacterium]|nr:hypothetical protein [Erysipelotrichaceae bacterium]